MIIVVLLALLAPVEEPNDVASVLISIVIVAIPLLFGMLGELKMGRRTRSKKVVNEERRRE